MISGSGSCIGSSGSSDAAPSSASMSSMLIPISSASVAASSAASSPAGSSATSSAAGRVSSGSGSLGRNQQMHLCVLPVADPGYVGNFLPDVVEIAAGSTVEKDANGPPVLDRCLVRHGSRFLGGDDRCPDEERRQRYNVYLHPEPG